MATSFLAAPFAGRRGARIAPLPRVVVMMVRKGYEFVRHGGHCKTSRS